MRSFAVISEYEVGADPAELQFAIDSDVGSGVIAAARGARAQRNGSVGFNECRQASWARNFEIRHRYGIRRGADVSMGIIRRARIAPAASCKKERSCKERDCSQHESFVHCSLLSR